MSVEGMVLDTPYDLWRHLLRPHKQYKTQSRLKTRHAWRYPKMTLTWGLGTAETMDVF
jgi:hypothetical protein